MKSHLNWLCLVSVGAALVCADSASAQIPTRNWTFTVSVDSRKPAGSAWDAFGGAPDIAMCTSSSAGGQCQMIEGAVARCQDAFNCRFTMALPLQFSVSIWDLDVASDDLIGNCYVARPGSFRCGSATVTAR